MSSPAVGQHEIIYPQPNVKWYPDAEERWTDPSPKGLQPPRRAAKPEHYSPAVGSSHVVGASVSKSISVNVGKLSGLARHAEGDGRYRVSAYYQSEASHVVHQRKTDPPEKANPMPDKLSLEECVLSRSLNVPFNSREQFLKVAVYRIDDKECDAIVGEATLPIADPGVAEMKSYPLHHDFEEHGMLSVCARLPPDSIVEAPLEVPTYPQGFAGMPSAYPSEYPSEYPVAASPAQALGRLGFGANGIGHAVVSSPNVLPRAPYEPPLPPSVAVGFEVRESVFEDLSPSRQPHTLGSCGSCSTAASTARLPSFGLNVGDAVEVFSRSASNWQRGAIKEITHSEITVVYGERWKKFDLRQPNLHECLRQAPPGSRLSDGDSSASPSQRRRPVAYSSDSSSPVAQRIAAAQGDSFSSPSQLRNQVEQRGATGPAAGIPPRLPNGTQALDRVYEWMWADAAMMPGLEALAKRNPWRWEALNPRELEARLKSLQECRPVRLRAAGEEDELEFETPALAAQWAKDQALAAAGVLAARGPVSAQIWAAKTAMLPPRASPSAALT